MDWTVKTIENIIKNKTILEIGCPSGKIAEKCDSYNKWYIVDPNKNNKIVFKDKIVFIETYFDDSFQINEKVDIIIHSHLFEHIYEPNEFLKKCNEMLIKDGEMIFGVPNMQYFAEKSVCLYLGVFFEHTIFLNKQNITYLLKKHGFEIINIIDYENHSTIYHTKKINTHALFINHKDNNNCISSMVPDSISNIECKLINYKETFFELIQEYTNFVEKCSFIIQNNIDKNVYIFGASYNTQFLLCNGLKRENIKGILDNCKEKQHRYLYGTNLKIYSPEILINEDAIVILKNGYYVEEINLQIQKINKNTIVIF
jgi:predicted SAM-dependent methyltransferase